MKTDGKKKDDIEKIRLICFEWGITSVFSWKIIHSNDANPIPKLVSLFFCITFFFLLTALTSAIPFQQTPLDHVFPYNACYSILCLLFLGHHSTNNVQITLPSSFIFSPFPFWLFKIFYDIFHCRLFTASCWFLFVF